MTPLLNLPVLASSEDTILHYEGRPRPDIFYVQISPESEPLPSTRDLNEDRGYDTGRFEITEVVPGVVKVKAPGSRAYGSDLRALIGSRPDYSKIVAEIVADEWWLNLPAFGGFSTVTRIYSDPDATFRLAADTPVTLRLSHVGGERIKVHPMHPLTTKARASLGDLVSSDGKVTAEPRNLSRVQKAIIASEQIGDLIVAHAPRFDRELFPLVAPKPAERRRSRNVSRDELLGDDF